MSNISVKETDCIETICFKCGKVSDVRGISYNQILQHFQIETTSKIEELSKKQLIRVCSSCRYRTEYNKRELTIDQKQTRKEYNQKRKEEINNALKLFRNK
jgi:hypothetical protein